MKSKMKFKSKDHYFKIPVEEGLGNCDLFLGIAMDCGAKNKSYRNKKAYLKKEFGCTGNEGKLMTEKKLNSRAVFLDVNEFPSKDAYRYVRKINTVLYATVIASVVKDYVKIASFEEKEILLNYAKEWRLKPTYQRVFCHPIFRAFEIVETDEKTANLINRIDNAKAVLKTLIDELSKNEIEIKL